MKLPKGYKVIAYQPVKNWYDARIWKDGQLLTYSTGTYFEFKNQAIELAKEQLFAMIDNTKP